MATLYEIAIELAIRVIVRGPEDLTATCIFLGKIVNINPVLN
jgi:hypothetical protein